MAVIERSQFEPPPRLMQEPNQHWNQRNFGEFCDSRVRHTRGRFAPNDGRPATTSQEPLATCVRSLRCSPKRKTGPRRNSWAWCCPSSPWDGAEEECLARAHSGRAAGLGPFARVLPATVEDIELKKRSLSPGGIEYGADGSRGNLRSGEHDLVGYSSDRLGECRPARKAGSACRIR